jgi:hypothetical protein
MRKKMLFLVLALAASVSSVTSSRAVASGTHACPICTTYPDGSQCCRSCICGANGIPIACTNVYCPPAGGV